MLRPGVAVLVLAGILAAFPAAAKSDPASLYRGPGPRPGPDILYEPPATAPQLTNGGVWRADPILVSGATAYRGGEFLYQDFLYDDHGARGSTRDPDDPRLGDDSFSAPNGTYTYPTAQVYAQNAADLVELRVKPLPEATAFRITLNALRDPSLVAATIALGDSPEPRPLPHGANASAPAELFLTVHGAAADLVDAATGAPAQGAPPTASVDLRRRQIEVRVPHSAWDPGAGTVRLSAGVGLWDPENDRYLIPGVSATEERPGGAAGLPRPTAFFNVAFRGDEPFPEVSSGSTLTDAAWWRDRRQGGELRSGNLGTFHTAVDFGKLAAGADDDSEVPRTGPMNRILASHFEPAQGVDFHRECGNAGECKGELLGRLQPYAIYVPAKAPPPEGHGLTLLLHSLGANYNQFSASRNQSQFGERATGSIVITPAGRGPDGWYYDLAGADVFEVWADVAAHYRLDPDYTAISGYSMGGYGTYKLATQFPDLFARGQPVVGPPGLGIWLGVGEPSSGGAASNTFRQLASLRNVPFMMWVASGDELVPVSGTQAQARRFDDLGYRYVFDVFSPAEHLTLALNDQYAPAADFLGSAEVERDPAHASYVVNPTMDFPGVGTVADHAYWLSGLRLRDAGGDAPLGMIDVRSEGFGVGDPEPTGTQIGTGTLTGGNLGTLTYARQSQDWGPPPAAPARDRLVIAAENVARVAINPRRARVGCDAHLSVETDGPLTVRLDGCRRVARFR
jgi:hypothetical protein